MNSMDYWTMFMQTGVPAIYLMYKNAKQLEEQHVSDGSGTGSPRVGIQ